MKKNYKVIGTILLVSISVGILMVKFMTGSGELKSNMNEDDMFVDLNIEKDKDKEESTIVVEIKGEVKNPNVYTLAEGSIILDLIEKAGGLTEDSDISNINRAEKLKANECIIINKKNDSNEVVNEVKPIHKSDKININSATAIELDTLQGIGPVTAENIIKYRNENGKFKAIEDIMNVDRIGQKLFDKIKDKIEV
ncbi:MAG: helix-hairpin-helix domain-containing protein [Clostridium sp.]